MTATLVLPATSSCMHNHVAVCPACSAAIAARFAVPTGWNAWVKALPVLDGAA